MSAKFPSFLQLYSHTHQSSICGERVSLINLAVRVLKKKKIEQRFFSSSSQVVISDSKKTLSKDFLFLFVPGCNQQFKEKIEQQFSFPVRSMLLSADDLKHFTGRRDGGRRDTDYLSLSSQIYFIFLFSPLFISSLIPNPRFIGKSSSILR